MKAHHTSSVDAGADLDAIAGEWNELAGRSDSAPFLYPDWIAAWARAFGGATPLVATLRTDGRLTAVLPLLARRGALVSPTNWHTPLFGAVAESEADALELLGGVLASSVPARLDLAFVDAESPLLQGWRQAIGSAGYRALERVIQRSPYVAVQGDWESYESALPSRRRGKYRRFRRRLDEQGDVELEVHERLDGLDAALDDALRVEAAGWKGEQGTAIRSRPETEAFYREIAAWAAGRDWLRLWFVRLDGRAIAFAYCLETTTVHYELKVGFDPEYAKFAPGVLLTQERLRHVFESGLRSYEFLGQPEPHKLQWTDTCRELVRIQAFAPTVRGAASRILWQRGRPAALRLRALARR